MKFESLVDFIKNELKLSQIHYRLHLLKDRIYKNQEQGGLLDADWRHYPEKCEIL